jgi:hypothetical protein
MPNPQLYLVTVSSTFYMVADPNTRRQDAEHYAKHHLLGLTDLDTEVAVEPITEEHTFIPDEHDITMIPYGHTKSLDDVLREIVPGWHERRAEREEWMRHLADWRKQPPTDR